MAKVTVEKKKSGLASWMDENPEVGMFVGAILLSVGVGGIGYGIGKRVVAHQAAEFVRKSYPGIMMRYGGAGAEAMYEAASKAAPEAMAKVDPYKLAKDAVNIFKEMPDIKADFDYCSLKKVKY